MKSRLVQVWNAGRILFLSVGFMFHLCSQGSPGQRVAIVWPENNASFSVGTVVKIKAECAQSGRPITQVKFFAETNLIGTVTNPPFNALWYVDVRDSEYGHWNLTAVIVDDLGETNVSSPVRVEYYTGAPTVPIVEIVEPRTGSVLVAPATFQFTAEILASHGETAPIEFYVGTNSVGLDGQNGILKATTPPSFVVVSNLIEGDYLLTVRYYGVNGNSCTCKRMTNAITVAKLLTRLPAFRPDGRFQFEIVTSQTGRQTVVEFSQNLVDWIAVSTNNSTGSNSVFVEAFKPPHLHRFYRVLLPAD